MTFFTRLAPGPAFRNLRDFVRSRKRYQIWALVVSAVLVAAILFGFIKDSKFFKPYKPEITYFQSWRLDRSDAEIKAKQAVDQVEIDKLKAELDKKQKARQQEFQNIDNTLTGWGL